MAMMAGGPAVEDNKGESNVCMPSGFPEYIEPPPQSRLGLYEQRTVLISSLRG